MEKKQGYKILKMAVVASNFSRDLFVDFDNPNLKTSHRLSVNQVNTLPCAIITELHFNALVNENSQAQAHIKILTEFVVPEYPPVPVDIFLKTNAPAIVYPFLREHLFSLIVKAGMKPFLLDTVNFLEFENPE